MTGKRGLTLEERFWSKVDKSGTCWLWTAYTRRDGYGVINIDNVATQAHRVAWMLTHGPIEKGLHIDHMCYNTLCVRPVHLRAVTAKQNIENRSKVNKNNTSGVRGVTWDKRSSKWEARVKHERRNHHAGYYAELADAEAAVVAKRNELYTHNELDRK